MCNERKFLSNTIFQIIDVDLEAALKPRFQLFYKRLQTNVFDVSLTYQYTNKMVLLWRQEIYSSFVVEFCFLFWMVNNAWVTFSMFENCFSIFLPRHYHSKRLNEFLHKMSGGQWSSKFGWFFSFYTDFTWLDEPKWIF